MNIKDLVKDKFVTFDSYRQGLFYYNINYYTGESREIGFMGGVDALVPIVDVYQFTVPVEDIGTATLLAEDKAITFMRWIRKAMQDGTITKNGKLLDLSGEVS